MLHERRAEATFLTLALFKSFIHREGPFAGATANVDHSPKKKEIKMTEYLSVPSNEMCTSSRSRVPIKLVCDISVWGEDCRLDAIAQINP